MSGAILHSSIASLPYKFGEARFDLSKLKPLQLRRRARLSGIKLQINYER